jgi:copper homeostasis protein (lipoprotein)
MFAYMADAPMIRLCADGSRLPVAMEVDYKALEAAYLKERRQPGEALLVSLDGLIAPRPSMEASRPPQLSLVVERFIGIWPRETCGNPLADSPLRNTYWKLVRLSDAPVRVAENQREPHVILALGQPRDGQRRLQPADRPLRARRRHAALSRHGRNHDGLPGRHGKVERYRSGGSHLEMLDATGVVLARFEAVALR